MSTPSPDCPPPDPDPRPPRRPLPAGATDCHAHIIGPATRYPFVANRSYTPPDALLPDYLHLLETLGISRAVLVQPSMHGTDNRAMMEAIAAAPQIDFRAVVVVPPDIDEHTLIDLHRQGARGVRINLVYAGGNVGIEAARAIAERIEPLGWHLQVLADIARLGTDLARLESLPVPVVIDHFGHMPATVGTGNAGFRTLLDMVARGRCWVKLSGVYRVSEAGPPYDDVRPYFDALLAAGPHRLVWGSDWPHTVCRHPMPNDGDLIDLLLDWVATDEQLQAILVDNPKALYFC